jgi:16S rRNA (cytidine1402-2'-O)-methyltransferase
MDRGHNPSMPSDPPASTTSDAVLHGLRVAAADAATQDYPPATLYVIATPIGNRADITVRALACLARVDAVAAEDTRTTRALLRHYGIDRPMIAAHHHNENEAAATLVARIAAGERIAYVSDAGTPGVSDPGARLAAAVRDAGHRVIPIPGASALTTAISAAGLPEAPLHFVGFLPAKSAQATTVLQALSSTAAHLVFYEAPHRIVDTLTAIAAVFAGRHCVIARELTKRFETIHRSRVEDAVAWITADPQRQRGEFVVIVEVGESADDENDRALRKALPILAKLCDALPVSQAASLTAEITGVSRKALYAEALKLRAPGDGAPAST